MSLAAFGWAIVGLLAIAASNVRAWSCSPSEHRYFLDCRARQCSDAFFVAHVSATGRCMRRHEVFEIDAETRRFVAGLAATSSRLREDGVYVLRIPGPG